MITILEIPVPDIELQAFFKSLKSKQADFETNNEAENM